MPSNIKDLIESEIAKRLSAMSTEELLRLAYVEGAQMPALHASDPRMTLKEALMRAMREASQPLNADEIIERVLSIRPGTPDPSIRSEISRARKMGYLRLHGDSPRGGTFTLSRSTIRPAARTG